MSTDEQESIIVRQLTSSDLGWFAELRDRGLVASKQRAINFNAPIIANLLPPQILASGEVHLKATCLHPAAPNEEDRILKKVGKNWRLGGRKVPGEVFLNARPGDFFICRLRVGQAPPFEMAWTVIFKKLDSRFHDSLSKLLAPHLTSRMAAFSGTSTLLAIINALPVPKNGSTRAVAISPPLPPPPPPPKSNPIPERSRRTLSVKERLRQPHIMGEMMRVSLSLSAEAQKDFLTVLEILASSLREMLDQANQIHPIDINHAQTWQSVARRPIAFIDGGTARLSSLGAEPIGIRVGSYTVIPGATDHTRETFRVENQLVTELYESTHEDGLYDGLFEDASKLREAARMALETAGAVACLAGKPKPHFLFLHGALVNPVSAYAQDKFPQFSKRGLEALLPPGERERTGRNAKFVSVYLKLLETLRDANVNVAGVVERASISSLVSLTLLDNMKQSDFSPGSTAIEAAKAKIRDYRITDAVLFHAILNEGEYVTPVSIDRNDLRRAPNEAKDLIEKYPQPKVTYVGVGEIALPLRVEFFANPPDAYETCIRLVIHACRLMPNYAFPAGLDIADKFAKVPDWMCRPVNSALAVQLLKRAIDTGNPKIIDAAKRMLCGTTRDWLFRPTFNS